MDIICRERTCIYNKGFSCTAKKISIDENMKCFSYKKNEMLKDIPDTSKNIFATTPPKYHSHREAKHNCINCKADCLFKNNDICEANGITINKIKNKPFCITYFKK